MGDRTNVTITVPKNDYERLLAKEGEIEATFRDVVGANEIDDDGDWVSRRGYEINYAEWGEVENILKENLIPLDKSWDAGGGFSAGESYVRVVNGEIQELEFHEDVRDEAGRVPQGRERPPRRRDQRKSSERIQEAIPMGNREAVNAETTIFPGRAAT